MLSMIYIYLISFVLSFNYIDDDEEEKEQEEGEEECIHSMSPVQFINNL